MKNSIFYMTLSLSILTGGVVASAVGETEFAVVGVYDEAEQANAVDLNAAYYEGNSSGVGQNASLVVGFDTFQYDILAAFSNGNGGVVNFDNGLIEAGHQTDSFSAVFGEKKLLIKSVDHLCNDCIASICTPISGPGDAPNGGFLAKSISNGDKALIRSSYNFTFEEIGFGDREHVRAVAGTILGRNGSAESSKWLMKVKLDNDDIIAAIADINFQSGNTRADTFFAAKAPKGRYITGVAWINLNGTYSGLDGLAFITNGAPKAKPSTPATPGNTLFGVASGGSDSGSGTSSLFGSDRPHR